MIRIKDIFDAEAKHVKFDLKLAKQIQHFVGSLMNRNEDHVMFFGSNLTGPYPLRFKTADQNEWFVDMLGLDEFIIREKIVKDTIINADWVRATDAFNMSCLYTIHRYLNSNLSPKDKKMAIDNTAMALNIKLMGSIMAAYFPYNADEATSQEVFARLSRKFYIKKYGSWRKVLEHRAEDITATTSKWLPVLTKFDSDEDLAQCISDIQGRLRSMIKYIWEVFAKVRLDQSKFNRTSMAIEIGGEKVIQDLKRDSDTYKEYALKIALDESTFIKPEMITIVDAEMRTMPTKLLMDALRHLVVLHNKANPLAEELIVKVIEHAIQTINSDRSAARNLNDPSWLIHKVKVLVMASKTNDPLVFRIRDITEKLIRDSVSTKNNTWIAALKTGLVLYIVGRAFSMRHYTN